MISNSLESTVYSCIPDRNGISNPDFEVLVVEGMGKSEYREKASRTILSDQERESTTNSTHIRL